MRLIDADAITFEEFIGSDGKMYIECITKDDIDNAPTVDAVPLYDGTHKGLEYVARDIVNKKGYIIGHYCLEPIVRCKDCKRAYKRKPIDKTAFLCELFGAGMKETDFCSFGERKTK